jgi:hypothetical protein
MHQKMASQPSLVNLASAVRLLRPAWRAMQGDETSVGPEKLT